MKQQQKNFEAHGAGASPSAGYGHVDDAPAAHRLRPWTTQRCAAALPTVAAFDHMPTAVDYLRVKERAGTTTSRRVTFPREATRPANLIVAGQPSSRPMPSATRAYAESPVWAPSSEAAWSARLSACLSKTAMPSSHSPASTRAPMSPDTTSAGGVYRSAARPNCAD